MAFNAAFEPCPWLCAAPDEPDTPFAWPAFFFFDLVRVYTALAALILVAISVWAVAKSPTAGQKTRFAYAGLLSLYVLGNAVERLGDWPNWKFPIGVAAVTLGVWGYWQHFFHEFPARDRPGSSGPRRGP